VRPGQAPEYYEIFRKIERSKERDRFTCCSCGDDESPLNVHHLYYKKGCAPWDYPDFSLLTLCEDCHEVERENENDLEDISGKDFKKCGLPASVIYDFVPTFWELTKSPYNIYEVWEAIDRLILAFANGGTSPDDITKYLITKGKNG